MFHIGFREIHQRKRAKPKNICAEQIYKEAGGKKRCSNGSRRMNWKKKHECMWMCTSILHLLLFPRPRSYAHANANAFITSCVCAWIFAWCMVTGDIDLQVFPVVCFHSAASCLPAVNICNAPRHAPWRINGGSGGGPMPSNRRQASI